MKAGRGYRGAVGLAWPYALGLTLFVSLSTRLPFSAAALLLSLALGLSALGRLRFRSRMTAVLLALFLLPRLLQPVVGWAAGSLLALPLLLLVDRSLRETAATLSLPYRPGRTVSPLLRTLLPGLALMFVVSLVTMSPALALSGTVLFLYFGFLSLYIRIGIPRRFLEGDRVELRVVAGNTAEVEFQPRSRARLPLHLHLEPSFPGTAVEPSRLVLRDSHPVKITLTPRLSGPSAVELRALALDPWGFFAVGQAVEAVNLLVIPRARFARWLVMRYLEGAGLGGLVAPVSAGARRGVRRGVEYSDSRPYWPGDRLKDIDWKHTFKLRQVIVKEYREAPGQRHIVLLNLEAGDVEEADRLVYNLLMALLALAQEGFPVSLSAYDRERVLEATPMLGPREALLKGLELSWKVTLAVPERRFLAPPNPAALRRLSEFFRRGGSAFEGLLGLLELESQALERLAREHPAGRALYRAASLVPSPATISVISGWNHDAEALSIALDDLKRKGYRVLLLGPEKEGAGPGI